MRWWKAATWLFVAMMAFWLHGYARRQEMRIDELRAEVDRLETHLPALIHSELLASEARIMARIEELAKR